MSKCDVGKNELFLLIFCYFFIISDSDSDFVCGQIPVKKS